MALLAGGITYAQKITIIVLCIVIAVFLVVDVVMVVALNRLNTRLVRNRKTDPPETEDDPPENKNNS